MKTESQMREDLSMMSFEQGGYSRPCRVDALEYMMHDDLGDAGLTNPDGTAIVRGFTGEAVINGSWVHVLADNKDFDGVTFKELVSFPVDRVVGIWWYPHESR